jgi:hypothetical protein
LPEASTYICAATTTMFGLSELWATDGSLRNGLEQPDVAESTCVDE